MGGAQGAMLGMLRRQSQRKAGVSIIGLDCAPPPPITAPFCVQLCDDGDMFHARSRRGRGEPKCGCAGGVRGRAGGQVNASGG
jgi:hypothetical protein